MLRTMETLVQIFGGLILACISLAGGALKKAKLKRYKTKQKILCKFHAFTEFANSKTFNCLTNKSLKLHAIKFNCNLPIKTYRLC